ncbi:MAG: CinA family protein [Pseudomonadota bacterium]|nr:CinA family protein [Pseudomonadota bacterium]
MTQILARQIIETAIDAGWMICTTESCTGGMVFAALTDIAGSSAVMDRGFVTYSNQAKQEMVGVSGKTLEAFGAVSEQTATEMAQGGIAHSRADISLSITGIAGPGGESAEKPVGLVWMAVVTRQGVQQVKRFDFSGDRIAIRQQALLAGLELIHAGLPKSQAR